MQAVSSVRVFRSPDLSVGQTFTQEVTESVQSRYRMVVDALSASEQRFSFSFRSPGQSVLLSPQAFIEFDVDLVIAGRSDFRGQMGPQIQRCDLAVVEDKGTNAPGYGAAAKVAAPPARVCFGSGDPVGQSLTSYNLVLNGASLSQVRQNDWKWSLDKCWISNSVFQKRFSQAGGSYDAYDRRPASGLAQVVATATGADDLVVGTISADSGIQKRLQNLLNATIDLNARGLVQNLVTDHRRVRVRWPINSCGIFQAGNFITDEMSGSCPLQQSCLAIPHANVCTLDLIFSDLMPQLFKNLSNGKYTQTTIAIGGAGATGVSASLVADSVQMHLEYLRTGPWRRIPEQAELQVYRINVHDASSKATPQNNGTGVVIPAAVLRDGVQISQALPCVGNDRSGSSGLAAFSDNKYLEASWNGITTAQAPSYIFFTLQKSAKLFEMRGEANGRHIDTMKEYGLRANTTLAVGEDKAGTSMNYLSRNTMSSCAIAQFSLEIQASLGSYTYSSDKFPFTRTRQELFRDHCRYVCPSYLDYGDINQWRKHAGCLLLGCDIWLRGLTSDACSFPMVFNCKVRFQNERQFYSGVGNHVAQSGGLAIQQDLIAGTPVMCCIYPKNSLTISASSAILSSANLSHASAMDIIQRGQ